MTPERLEEIRQMSYGLSGYEGEGTITELLAEVDRLRGLEALAPYMKPVPFSYTVDIPMVRLDAVVRLRDYIIEQRNAADSVARDPSLGHIGIAFVTANVYTGILTKGIEFGVFPMEPEESEVPS